MTSPIDPTDVPFVDGAIIVHAIEAIVHSGHGEVFLNGGLRKRWADIEPSICDLPEVNGAETTAVCLRVMAIIDVLQCQRLTQRFHAEGLPMLMSLGRAAARCRLNANWGFCPQRLIWRIKQEEARVISVSQRTRTRTKSKLPLVQAGLLDAAA